MSIISFIEKLLDGNDVEWKALGTVTNIKTGRSVNKQVISENPGPYPVINSGREPLGFINEWNTDNDPIGITTRGAGVGSITWQEGRYFRGSLNYAVTINRHANIKIRYLYHLLLEMQSDIQSLCTFDGIPALNAGNLKELQIPIPCPENPKKSLEIQAEIVRILDTFTELNAELNAELTARNKQYSYYRDKLFSFEEGLRLTYMEKLLDGNDVKWKALGTVTTIKTGGSVNKQVISDNPGPYPVINSGREPLGFINKWNTDNDPIGITTRGAGVGSITWQNGKYFRGNLNYAVTINREAGIDTRYLYHLLLEMQSDIQALCTFDGIPALNAGNLKELQIPIPCPENPKKSLEIQAEIVRILDKFDLLSHSINHGLPREIELRKTQYGYYRNLLLNFPKPQEVS